MKEIQFSYVLKYIIVGILFLFIRQSYAQEQTPDFKFEHFIDDKGLNQNTILDVAQDNDGYLWIGTANGLYRYDGQRFTIYRNQPNQSNTVINNVVNKLEIDNHENLWIGTVNGLCTFNLKTQRFSKAHTNLLDKEITSIYTDKVDGSIWVGTSKSGLYHILEPNMPTETIEHFFHQPNQPYSINDNQILSIAKDNFGNLWVGTLKGLNRMFLSKASVKNFIHVEGVEKPVNTLLLDKKGRLWVGELGNGLLCLEKPTSVNTLSLEIFKIFPLDLDNSFENFGTINAIEEGVNGNLWVGVYGYGLYLLNPETGKYSLYAPNDMDAESLSNRRVTSVLIDKTNVLWVGTKVGGLNKCDLQKKNILFLTKNKLSNNTLSNPSVNTVLEDDNYLWVGTENGLNKIEFKDNYKLLQIEHYFFGGKKETSKPFLQQSIKSIIKDRDNDYWLGKDIVTHMQVDTVSKHISFHSTDLRVPDVFSILEDKEGVLWFGSFSSGLVKWKKKRKPNSDAFDFSNAEYFKSDLNDEYSIGGDFVSCLYGDSKGNLWIGSMQGGVSLLIPGKDGKRDHFISFQHNPNNLNSLSHNSVFSIHEDRNGDYWIGTFGGGLNKMTLPKTGDLEPVFKYYSEEDGLANNAVYGILEDDNGKLWMSTDNGISCFNPEDETFKNFNKEDGLQSNNFRKNAYYKNQKGYMFFGGLRGLNIFHPDNLKDNTISAPVKLTGFKIKSENVSVGKEYNGRILLDESLSLLTNQLKLKHHENTLTFEFAALHYAAPEKNKFKYQLVGFDKNWQESKGLSFAHYTNLSPGSYTFIVKASNNDGVWNDVPAQIGFKIAPPFWLTWWAYVLYVLMFSGIVFGFVSYYRLQEKEKAAVRVQKEVEEVNKLKLQFFTNISHDFKTPITLILNPLEEILENAKDNFLLRPKLKLIERNANYLLRLVNQLMEFRKIEVGETKLAATKANIINFVREITFSFRSLAEKKNIELSFESQLYASEVWFDWDKLEKILNNLIFNAVKFTNEGGRVVVRINKPQMGDNLFIEDKDMVCEYLKIEVEDNGPGIASDQLPYVFQRFYQVNNEKKGSNSGSGIGLAITRDLVDMHYGTIEVNSKEREGSCFIIKLPLGNKHLSIDEMVEYVIPEPLAEDQLDEEYGFIENEETLVSSESTKTSVLVVDDNVDIRELVKNGLSGKYQIFEAENGKEALHVALKEMPDLIISDVLMPEMDGIEFCHELKNNIRTSHIPVVLLTALNSVEHRIKGLESGADAYIPKPFKMKLLEVRVDKLIESREAMRKRFQTEDKITPSKVTLNSLDREFLEKIMALMEENMGNDSYWVDQLAADMNTSRSTFFRKLKKLTGQPPNDFIRMIRLKRAAQLLEQNQLTIAEVSYKVGFNDPGYFGKCFRKVYGQSPSQYVGSQVG